MNEDSIQTPMDEDLGFVPVEERGGAVSLIEGEPGPVGAIALATLSMLKGEEPDAQKLEEALGANAAGRTE